MLTPAYSSEGSKRGIELAVSVEFACQRVMIRQKSRGLHFGTDLRTVRERENERGGGSNATQTPGFEDGFGSYECVYRQPALPLYSTP